MSQNNIKSGRFRSTKSQFRNIMESLIPRRCFDTKEHVLVYMQFLAWDNRKETSINDQDGMNLLHYSWKPVHLMRSVLNKFST